MLTGRPRIVPLDPRTLAPVGGERGVEFPYAHKDGPMGVKWRQESEYAEGADGQLLLREPRTRAEAAWSWWALTELQKDVLKGIGGLPFGLIPRSRAPGDPPDEAELFLVCRLTSALPETTPLGRTDGAAVPLWEAAVEAEGLFTYPTAPGALRGGLVVEAETETDVAVRPWGTASLTEEPGSVQFMGQTFPITLYRLDPADVVAATLRVVEGEPDVVRLHALYELQLP